MLVGEISGVRGLLLDMDGVLVLRGQPLPGAAAAIRRLDSAGVPYVVITNTSLVSRRTLAAHLSAAGFEIPADRIVTAASAAADYVRREFAEEPLYVLGAPDAMTEFDGLHLLSHDDAAAGVRAAAVVVGDAAEQFTPRNLQSAFRQLRGGAAFLAMHKNRWWLTPEGETLDAGGYVAALEFGTERAALVIGKPNAEVFLDGVRQVGGGAGTELEPGDVAMVGDDIWNDIEGALKAGLRGIFVLTGKHGSAELDLAGRAGWKPDWVKPSIVEVVEAIATDG